MYNAKMENNTYCMTSDLVKYNMSVHLTLSLDCLNPSLTFMAITARASNYAIKEIKKGNI